MGEEEETAPSGPPHVQAVAGGNTELLARAPSPPSRVPPEEVAMRVRGELPPASGYSLCEGVMINDPEAAAVARAQAAAQRLAREGLAERAMDCDSNESE
eukprot:4935234-Prymnesium_polylepis.1